MIRAPLTQSGKVRITDRGAVPDVRFSGFAECETQVAGFPEKPRKLKK
jgi:hypothetical protein